MDIAALQEMVSKAAPMASCETRTYNREVVAHIDGDYLAYFAAGGDDCSPGDARLNVLSRVSKLRTVSGCGSVVIHLTHPASTKGDRFFAATSKPYQGQRDSGRKPKNWEFLRNWLVDYDEGKFTTKQWTTREADDGMCHVSEFMAEKKGVLHVIHTRDKDMQMFCGLHVSWLDYHMTEVPRGSFEVLGEDGKTYGHKWFWMQMLTGDAADNIPGLPGVGAAKAAAILQGSECNEEAAMAVRGAYSAEKGEGWEDYFVEQAALLWMRRDAQASLLDFMSLNVFGGNIIEASKRLATSVADKKADLEALMNG